MAKHKVECAIKCGCNGGIKFWLRKHKTTTTKKYSFDDAQGLVGDTHMHIKYTEVNCWKGRRQIAEAQI